MRLMASLVCAIESTRSLRCVVRNAWRVSSSSNCSIAIMLTGPEPLDLAAQRGDRFLGAQRRAAWPPPRQGPASKAATLPRVTVRASVMPSSSVSSSASTTAASGVVSPVALELIDFDDDLVERGVHGVLARVRQMREVGFGRRARDVELGDHRADRVEDAARVLDRRFELVGARTQRRAPPRRWSSTARGAHPARARRRPAALRPPRWRRPARRRAAWPRPSSSTSAAARAASSSAPASSRRVHFDRQGAGSLHERGVRRAGFRRAAGSGPRPPRALRTAGAAPRSAARRPARCASSSRPIDARASACRRSSVSRSSSAWSLSRAAARPSARGASPRRSRAAAARRVRRRPCPACDARRSARRSRWWHARSSPRAPPSRCASRISASRSAAMRSRSSLISRLVSRMPRDSARPPPDTMMRAAEHVAVQRRDRQRREPAGRRSARRTTWRSPASPTACRIAAANGPLTRTTDDSATTLCGQDRLAASSGGRTRHRRSRSSTRGTIARRLRAPPLRSRESRSGRRRLRAPAGSRRPRAPPARRRRAGADRRGRLRPRARSPASTSR